MYTPRPFSSWTPVRLHIHAIVQSGSSVAAAQCMQQSSLWQQFCGWNRLVDARVQRRMAQLVPADKKFTVTQTTARYSHGEEKSISEHTTLEPWGGRLPDRKLSGFTPVSQVQQSKATHKTSLNCHLTGYCFAFHTILWLLLWKHQKFLNDWNQPVWHQRVNITVQVTEITFYPYSSCDVWFEQQLRPSTLICMIWCIHD